MASSSSAASSSASINLDDVTGLAALVDGLEAAVKAAALAWCTTHGVRNVSLIIDAEAGDSSMSRTTTCNTEAGSTGTKASSIARGMRVSAAVRNEHHLRQ